MVTLVTGGAGFVGQHLVSSLRARGERVRVLDLASPVHEDDMLGSITSEDDVARACDGVSSIFHLAGNAQLWARDSSVFERVNFLGTEKLLTAAIAHNVRKFIHCSSLTTLVGNKTPRRRSAVDESVMLTGKNMLGPYPKSKLLAEGAVLQAAREGLDAVIAIPTEPLGPGDESLTPPTKMILDFLNGKTPAYIDCMLNFVPVGSLAEGLIAARDKGKSGERYILGGDNISLRHLLRQIEEFSGRRMPSLKLPYEVALIAGLIDSGIISRITGKPPKAPLTGVRLAGRHVVFSSQKAENDLGWQADPTQNALRESLAWLDEAGLTNTKSRKN